MKTLIVGLGNRILRDDGVGPRIAATLKNVVVDNDIAVVEANVGGLGLVELMAGYDRAIVIDAIQTVSGRPGKIHRLDAEVLQSDRSSGPLHDLDFAAAQKLYRATGMPLPRQIVVFAIEATDVRTFGEECTPEVMKAIPICVEMIRREIEQGSDTEPRTNATSSTTRD